MKKIIIILILACFSSFLYAQQVHVSCNMPSECKAGESFTIEIVINKLSLQNYGEFIQELPKGFTATPKEFGTAVPEFENQKVKFSWIRLPREKQFKFSYEIKVPENFKDTLYLNAQFIYLFNNQRGQVYVNLKPVFIKKVETIVKNIIKKLFCYREKEYDEAKKIYTVKLSISKGIYNGKALVQETIPETFTAVKADDYKGLIPQINKNNIDFSWQNMPNDTLITVFYKLIPKDIKKSSDPTITGIIKYHYGNENYISDIIDRTKKTEKKKDDKSDDDIKNFFNK